MFFTEYRLKQPLVIAIFLMVLCIPAWAQKITMTWSVPQSSKTGVSFPDASYKDSLSAVKSLHNFLLELNKRGYLEASIDSIIANKGNWIVVLYTGEVYRYATLKRGSLPLSLANKVGFSSKQFKGAVLNVKQIYELEEKVVKAAENNGYPFASIGLDSIQFDEQHRLTASWRYEPGPVITIDSLIIVGNFEVKYKFFQRLVRIEKGDPFSQLKIDQSQKILAQLPYVKTMSKPISLMTEGSARVSYYLEKKKANLLDGYIGFLPNAAKNNKLLVTGDVKLELKNLFRSGKTLSVNWQSFSAQSQYLRMYYEHPRILGTGVDVSGLLEITRQDSSFLNINREVKISQQLGGAGLLDIFAGLKTGRILSQRANTDSLHLAYGDFNNYTYGVGYTLNKLDNVFYPKRGFFLTTRIYLGSKTIHKNPFYGEQTYKNVRINTYQFNVEILAEKYVRLTTKNIVMIRVNTAQVFNDVNSLFLNDLYRVGGLRTLRGFNEKEFYVSRFGIGTLEYRFHTDEESYLLLFTDQAFITNPYDAVWNLEYVYGLGAGISFTTAAGVFNFVYSVGQSSTQKLSLTLSKIHFGLVSKF
ncbi:MAG: outer membrane protein [Chitinophagaceae bacterium]|nr:outer membrane protein [Chitinophagaceae bacterium]